MNERRRHIRSRGAALLMGALLALALAAPAAGATTYYVEGSNASCTDSGPGNQSTPYCTITKASKRARAGDTVQVGSGIYVERVTTRRSGTPNAPITIQGSPGAVIQGSTRAFSLSSRSWIIVRGFEVRATTDHAIYVSSSSNITIESNHVHHVGQPIQGAIASGIHLTGTTDSLVRGNLVDSATDSGIGVKSGSHRVTVEGNRSTANARGYTRAAAGIDVRNSNDVVVQRNRTWANEDSGINIWDSSGAIVRNNDVWANGDHGIDNKTSTGTKIVANSVFGGVDSGIEVVGAAAGVVLANNLSVDNGINSPRTSGNIRVNAEAAASISLNHDLLWLSQAGVMVDWAGTMYTTLAAFVAGTGHESSGISADPKFVSAGSGDLRLRSGSPAIDSANANAPSHPSQDIDGLARVDDPGTDNTGVGSRTYDDRGAHEFQPSGGGGPPPPNQDPTAVADTATVAEDAGVTMIDVLANDTDPDGGPIVVDSLTQPVNGTADIVSAGAAVSYQPAPGYCNDGAPTDDFTYTLAPGGSTATVEVTVTCGGDPPPPPPGNETLTFQVDADAEIRGNVTDGTFGSDPTLTVDASPQREWLMRFVVSGIGSRTVTGATVVLWCVDDSKGGGSFARVTDQSWDEATVTWSTAPQADPTSFTELGAVSLGSSYDVDVSSLITGDGTFSFRASSPLNNDAGYASRDHPDASMRPVLIVTVSS